MDKYNYIPSKNEYLEIRNKCNKLEDCTTPGDIAIASRDLLQSIISFIYDNKGIQIPTSATMLELIDGKIIREFVDNEVLLESIHYVRKIGIDAQHGDAIKKKYAQTSKDNIEFFLQFVITKIEKPAEVKKIVLPKYMTEAETRKIYIDKYIKEAGWDVVEPNNETEIFEGKKVKSGDILPNKACCEILVEGMNNATGKGFCDYVLFDKSSKPLAVIEAKKTSADIKTGVAQVKEYGRCMKEKYGYTPVLYYTNGYEIYVIDGLYVERRVMGFHSYDELELMIQRRNRGTIDNTKIDTNIAGRHYQIQAITKVCERFSDKYRRGLLVMATGTGKTRVSIALCKVLLENDWIKNILFLADRTSLVKQAFNNFNKILPNMSYCVLSDKSLANTEGARVTFSTHQTMINYIDAEEKKFTCGRFDLIIIDEAHRSIFNKYGSIFKYFDSLLVGLTATPRNDVDADTYKLFGCNPGEPHFEYKLDDAVKEKYLVPYRVESRTTKLFDLGIRYGDLSDDDKEKVNTLIVDDEEPEDDYIIPKSKLFKLIYNEDTCSKVLDDLMSNGIRVEAGQLIGKTIIFAYNHKHAEMIVRKFKEDFPNYGDEYCQLIDNKVKGADELIEKFEIDKKFRIAVSVDMLDTGVDVPEVLNLVFFKPVKSSIKFVQMIGRGTRLCEGLIDGKDKSYFLIFDYCNNFEFFEEHPNYCENPNAKSLSQRMFDVKLDILVELQSYDKQIDALCKSYYDRLKPELYNKTKKVKEDSSSRIAVRNEMPYVDKYADYDRWDAIAPLAKKEIKYHISKLIDNDIGEDVNALRFDMQMLQIELAVLAKGESGFAAKQVERVRKVAKLLLDYAAGKPAVMNKADVLIELRGEDFWSNPTVDRLEKYREDIRNLLIYLPPRVNPVNIDLEDEIIEVGTKVTLIDIRTYKEKVIDYLVEQTNNPTIMKIKNLEKIDNNDINELQKILWTELGTKEDYFKSTDKDNVAVFIRSLVGIDQGIINEKFGKFLSENVLNSMQQEYLQAIINYVRENGDIEGNDLIDVEPFASYDIVDLFGENIGVVKEVISTMHDCVSIA